MTTDRTAPAPPAAPAHPPTPAHPSAPAPRPKSSSGSGHSLPAQSAQARPALTVVKIEQALRRALQPEQLEVIDDSAAHVGHADTGGRGHFRVRLVSTRFAGLSALQRHRLVNDVLAPLWQSDLHAVSITALSPEESR